MPFFIYNVNEMDIYKPEFLFTGNIGLPITLRLNIKRKEGITLLHITSL